MRLAQGRVLKPCVAALGRFFRELSTGAAGESSVLDSASFIHPSAVVHRDAVIGRISQDVPKYMMVAGGRADLRGLNLEGLRQHGFTDPEMRCLRTAYQRIFMPSNANPAGFEERLAELEQHKTMSSVPAVPSMIQSIRDCFKENGRGICKFRHWNAP